MSLTSAQVDAIARQVYRQYPEVQGQRPSVQRQAAAPGSKSTRPGSSQKDHFVVTFKGRQATPDGRTIVRIVRATTDERGKILKISTSK
jgi:hypothetical protein